MKSHPQTLRAALRFAALAVAVLGGLLAFHTSALSATSGHTGQALALQALMHPQSAFDHSLLPPAEGASGRYRYDRSNWIGTAGSSFARQQAHATTAVVNPNNVNDQPVQTFDALAPPTTNFQPVVTGAYGANNHTPVWSADESYIVFSSNLAGDGHDHLFYVAAGGGVPVQITTGTGDEEFPALNAANNSIAFTSTNNAAGVANLYLLSNFSPNANAAPVDVATLTSVTIRSDLATGFSVVKHPTFSPGGDRIAFSALSTGASDSSRGHYHIYYLYTDSLGYRDTTGSSSDNPPAKLTNGPSEDTDPAWSFDGRYIAFASTATLVANNTNSAIDPSTNNAPTLTGNPTTNGGRSLFLLSGGSPQPDPFGTSVQTGTDANGNPIVGRLTVAGLDTYGPAWSYITNNQYLNPAVDANRNPITDTNGNALNLEYLAFARSAAPGNAHDIYYLRTEQFPLVGAGNITPEGSAISYSYQTMDANGNQTVATTTFTNNAVHLNTSDTGNAYDDTYPTFAPLQSVFRIAYGSNRSVTYDNIADGTPSETAISLPDGANGVGTSYHGLLESEIVNVNPPTLLRFSGSEVIHVNAGATAVLPTTANPTGSATKSIQPSQPVTFTVRLSNREAGIANTGDPTTGNAKVYLQIKDPSSSTQNTQGLEHKVFTTDAFGLDNRVSFQGAQFGDSGTATNVLFNGGDGNPSNLIGTPTFTLRGSVGGRDGGDYIAVGHYNANTDPANPGPTLSINPPSGRLHPYPYSPAIDNNFQPLGQEYECQYVNPQYAQKGTGDTAGGAGGDYGTPYYLAGFDDGGALVGFRPATTGDPATPPNADQSSRPTRPTQPATDGNGTTLPAEWLEMTKSAQQDTLGGVLYTATFVTPRSGSDFFLDVIGYDQAVFPAIPPPTASNIPGVQANPTPNNLQPFAYLNQNGAASGNFRIYDNTGGFSTSPFDGSHDILVVSDNALGQKFAFSIADASSQLGAQNLKPTLYGAESYFTDVDPSLVPNAAYLVTMRTSGAMTGISEDVQAFAVPAETGLGPNSYSSASNQQYSIWRTLSRGSVPESVLKTYETTTQAQPAVNDPTTKYAAPAADGTASPLVPVAKKCVVWVAPYTGDLLTDAGSLADTSTQQELRRFVLGDPTTGSTSVLKAGAGRLFISGPDVAEALTSQGNVNNTTGSFITDVLNASFASPSGGSYNPTVTAATGNRILYDAYYNANPALNVVQNFEELTSSGTFVYQAPGNSSPFLLANDLVSVLPTRAPNYRTDASLDEFTPIFRFFGNALSIGSIDTIAAQNGAHSDLAFGSAKGLTYLENLKDPSNKNTVVNGSRTVFMSFGLEALGTEYYSVTINSTKFFAARNLRPDVLHNIVDYLRTGTFTGFVRTSTGTGVPGATVYLYPNGGTTIPGATRQLYSATTDSNGQYTIDGVEPGAYMTIAYEAGYTSATTGTTGSANVVDGDAVENVNLVINKLPPGGIAGRVTNSATPAVGIDGATVSFTPTGGGGAYTAITSGGGYYTIANVPAGTYTGTASKLPQYGSAAPTQKNPITVVSNTNAAADFVLPAQPATLSGTVFGDTNANGTQDNGEVGISGATVALTTTVTGVKTPAAVTTAANGTYTITGIAPGTYTLTVSKSLYTTKTYTLTFAAGAALTQNVPLVVTPVAPNGSLGGLVQSTFTNAALSGATVTVTDDNNGGATVATVTTTGTVIAPNLNYGPISLKPGKYSVKVTDSGYGTQTLTGLTVASSVLTRADFTVANGNALVPGHVFPAGLNFFSVPYDFGGAGYSFDGVFGALGDNRSHIYVYSPTQLQYVLDPTPPADGFRLGQGYWVKLTNPVVAPTAATAGTSTISVSLGQGWNMIGVPSPQAISVSGTTGLQFPNPTGAGSLDFDTASGSQYRLISPVLYGYVQSTNIYTTVTSGGMLQPWQAYWIYAYTKTTVLIPTQP